MVQIDLFATEVIDPIDFYLIYEDTTTSFNYNPARGMKLGPNGKIYYAHKSEPVLIEINNPDSPGELMQIEEISLPDNTPSRWDFGGSFAAYNTPPEMSIEGDTLVCLGAEALFSVDLCIDPIEWSVEGPAEIIDFTDNAIQCSFVDTGLVILTASALTLCGELSDTLYIEVSQAPELDLGPDMGYCLSDPTITLDMGDEFDSYLWSDGSSNQTLSLSNPEPQIIQATGYFGECFVTDEIEILGVLANEIDLGLDSDLCDGTAVILDAGEGYVDYVWQDGSNGQTYTAFLGGNYYVTTTIPCFATDSIYIDECGQSIDDTVDVSTTDISRFSGMSIFPNPTSSEATLRYYSTNSGKSTLEVFNILGKCIRREEILINVGVNNIPIRTASLATGQYFVILQDSDSLMTEPFVIVR